MEIGFRAFVLHLLHVQLIAPHVYLPRVFDDHLGREAAEVAKLAKGAHGDSVKPIDHVGGLLDRRGHRDAGGLEADRFVVGVFQGVEHHHAAQSGLSDRLRLRCHLNRVSIEAGSVLPLGRKVHLEGRRIRRVPPSIGGVGFAREGGPGRSRRR